MAAEMTPGETALVLTHFKEQLDRIERLVEAGVRREMYDRDRRETNEAIAAVHARVDAVEESLRYTRRTALQLAGGGVVTVAVAAVSALLALG